MDQPSTSSSVPRPVYEISQEQAVMLNLQKFVRCVAFPIDINEAYRRAMLPTDDYQQIITAEAYAVINCCSGVDALTRQIVSMIPVRTKLLNKVTKELQKRLKGKKMNFIIESANRLSDEQGMDCRVVRAFPPSGYVGDPEEWEHENNKRNRQVAIWGMQYFTECQVYVNVNNRNFKNETCFKQVI